MENGVLEINQSPILITGCARSGTSLIAGVINISGAYGGRLLGPNPANAKGMFENSRIREGVEKMYLRSIGCDPKGQKPLPDTSNLPIPSDWRKRVNQIMLDEGYKDGPWFYKGAKMCLNWPVWHYAYPNAKWVIVRRRSADIAKSCLNTSFMNAYSTHQEWIGWVNHHEKCFVEMIQAGLNVKMVWPERLVHGNYEQLYELIDWLGLTWKSQEVINFIDPKLWKAKIKQGMRV
jgi:Uncharacterized protein conserved in bacteria